MTTADRVTANLKLVRYIAKKFYARGLDLEDLVQEGNIGLIKAAERFDESMGTKFSVYAIFWIRAMCMVAIYESGAVGLRNSKGTRQVFWKYGKTVRALEQAGIDPTNQAVADHLGLDVGTVDMVLQRLYPRDVHLDSHMVDKDHERGSRTYSDALSSTEPSPEETTCELEAKQQTTAAIERALKQLNKQERDVIRRRYLQTDEVTIMQDIADDMGVSRQRVHQVEVVALRKLRGILKRAA